MTIMQVNKIKSFIIIIIIFSAEFVIPQHKITIDANVQYQTLEGFGGSDAWNCEYVGKYWSDSEKEAIAKLLFSKATDSLGNPEGIGLSRWRFNIGAGSEEQKPLGNFDKPERRVECFLNSDGSYNWNKQIGQQWFLRKANEYGVESLIAFSNSPPVFFTRNGLAHGSDGSYSNLAADKYGDFANFLTTTLKHFATEGINFEWISPVNEPQYDWTSGQEGCTWLNSEIFKIIGELNSSIFANGLDTKILTPEAGSWEYLNTQKDNVNKSNQIEAFFNPTSGFYLGNYKNVPNAVCGHTYWTFSNNTSLVTVRNKVNHKAQLNGLDLYQTEYSELSSIDERLSSYMDHALFMAKVIYADLTLAHSKAWSYWTVLERERWDQQNRFYLIRIKPSDGDYGDLTKSGIHYASKTLWTLGNYSRFVRPGYKLLKVSGASNLNSLMGSAFVAQDSSKLVIVLINYEKSSQEILPELTNLPIGKNFNAFNIYLTDAASDLKYIGDADKNKIITLPARSVVTLVSDLVNSTDNSDKVGSWSLEHVDSEEIIGENGAAINAFDGNVNTYWHTQWNNGSPGYPHEIQINLGSITEINGFSYLPRQYDNLNGTIKDYEFYVSQDGKNWGNTIASGTWVADKSEKQVVFDKVTCQYIKLVGKSEINGNNWASAAEIKIFDEIVNAVDNEIKKTNNGFELYQNYPNPFNAQCNIKYTIPSAGFVKMDIYNSVGEKVKTLVDQYQQEGTYQAHWDFKSGFSNNISSGVYIYKLNVTSKTGAWSQSKKMTYLK